MYSFCVFYVHDRCDWGERLSIKMKRTAALALGIALVSAAIAPSAALAAGDAAPLVEELPVANSPQRVVLSHDSSTLYTLSMYGEGQTIDTSTRQITGTFPLPDDVGYRSTPNRAIGDVFAINSYGGYSLLNLTTLTYEEISLDPLPGETDAPYLAHVLAQQDGTITGVTETGEFLKITGTTAEVAAQFHDDSISFAGSGASPDGLLYFETVQQIEDPGDSTTTVYSMIDGSIVASLTTPEDRMFDALFFDDSDSTLWGFFDDEIEALVPFSVENGTLGTPINIGIPAYSLYTASAQSGWFISSDGGLSGGALADAPALGARASNCCISSAIRLPENGDAIYLNPEASIVGFIQSPSITNPGICQGG